MSVIANKNIKVQDTSLTLENIANGVIVDSGTGSGVHYVKYNDGTMIQYFTQSIRVSSSRSAGGLTYYSGVTTVNLPVAFTDTNYVCASNIQQANMNYFAQSYVAQNNSSQVQVAFASTGSSETRNIQVMLIGKWK